MLESCDSVSEIFASASDIELYSYLGNISNNVFRDSFIRPGYKFGDFKNTRGWVQCELQNNPVRRYYLNLRSLCTTRIRPVPLDVPLQIYSPSDRLYDSESDPEDQLLTVSDNEQKHDDCFVGSAASVVSGIASERNIDVFRKLYYGIDVRGIISDKDSEDSEESWNFMETNSQKENKIQSNYVPVKKSQGDAKPTAVLQETMEEQAETRYLLSNFSDVQLRVSPTPLRLGSLKNKKNGNTKLSNNKNGMKPHFAARLQNFRKSKLMITEKEKRSSAQKVVKKKQKPQFTVCEMYGTRTFNYNSDPEYSAIRKITNLSDSSVGTACWVDQEAKAIKSNSFWDNQLSLEIQGPNLSSSSSCSTSSSSCSTSSSSSSSGSSDSSGSSSDDSNSSSDDSKSSNDKINSSGMKNNSSSDKTNTSSNEK